MMKATKDERPLGLGLSEGLGPNVQEDGPWEFGYDVTKGKAYVDSQDFNHDARLHISGDFGGTDEAQAYAKEIARRLNAAPEVERLRTDLLAAKESAKRWQALAEIARQVANSGSRIDEIAARLGLGA